MFKLLGRGSAADVFDLEDGTALKAYRRVCHTQSQVHDWSDQNFITRCFFAAEAGAYESIQAYPNLTRNVPAYYGRTNPADLALPASSTGEPFLPHCGLRLERIVGLDYKWNEAPLSVKDAVESVLERIRDIVPGINVWDSSCIVPESKIDFTLIDFGLWDHWDAPEVHLDEHGYISPEVRRKMSFGLDLPPV